MNQFWLLLIFGGIAFLSWLFGKLKEQAEINRAKQQSRRRYDESLRTGRSEEEPAAAPTATQGAGMPQDLRTLAQRRQEQLRALREQQAERMRRAAGGRQTTTTRPPDPSSWTRGQSAAPPQPARRPTPPPPIRRQPTMRTPQQPAGPPSGRQTPTRRSPTPRTQSPPKSAQRQTPQRRQAPPPPTRTRHERGQRIIEVERTQTPRRQTGAREASGTRSLLVPFSQEAMSATAGKTRQRPARFNRERLREAVIMFEVFNKPVCMRDPDHSAGSMPFG